MFRLIVRRASKLSVNTIHRVQSTHIESALSCTKEKTNERLAHLSSSIDCWVKAGPYPFAVCGMYDAAGNELFQHVSNKDNSKHSVDKDSIFRLYSMTKPFTAVATMMLVERGLLSLDDEVCKWIPAFKDTPVYTGGDVNNYSTEPLRVPLTIRHLLIHATGLPFIVFGQKNIEKIIQKGMKEHYTTGYRNYTNAELCEQFAKGPLCFQPGSGFEYGLNFEILGHILELASGRPLQELFQKEILTPLKLEDTSFFLPSEKLHRLAAFHFSEAGHISKCYTQERFPEIARHELPPLVSGGSGLNSTLHDYSRFARFLMRGGELDGVRLLSKESIDAMTSNQLLNGADVSELSPDRGAYEVDVGGFGYGYGVSVVINPAAGLGCQLSSVGEFGWGGLGSTFFYVDPVRQYTLVLMSSLMPSNKYPFRAQLRYLSHWAMQGLEKL